MFAFAAVIYDDLKRRMMFLYLTMKGLVLFSLLVVRKV